MISIENYHILHKYAQYLYVGIIVVDNTQVYFEYNH